MVMGGGDRRRREVREQRAAEQKRLAKVRVAGKRMAENKGERVLGQEKSSVFERERGRFLTVAVPGTAPKR